MLLRVDKVSGGNNPTDPQPSSSDPPLHACLATATVHQGNDNNNNDGSGDNTLTQGQGGGSQIIRGVPHAIIPASPKDDNENTTNPNCSGDILTVGRKNCAVTIDDKCVSRGHATISLLSNRPLDSDAIGAASSLLGGRVMMEFGTSSTPEEIHACETSPCGVICVVKDQGSKFGTYVSVDEQLLKEYQPSNDYSNNNAAAGGGDETGDETDDEGAAAKPINYVHLSEKQIRAVHLLSDNADSNNATTSVPKFQKLVAHQSVPLLPLSHSKSDLKSSPHVVILFGPQGSAIRLSLLPLQFTFSRIKKPELDPILSSLHYIGATHSTQWDVKRSTHLVAPEKTAAAKGIMAYACRRPVVTKGYIEGLLERRVPEEGLPKEDDYCPSGTWDRNLKYTAEPSTALKGYRIAVMVDEGDNAPLAQSAGADILPIHEDAPSSSHADFETWWGAQMHRALDDKLALVVVSSSSKKCKRYSDWLKHDEGVRFTNAKNIAKAITNNNGEGELLLDTRKVVIEKIQGWDDAVVVDEGKEEEDAKMAAADAPARASAKAATAAAPEEETAKAANKTHQDENPPPPGNDDHEQEESREEELPVSTRRKRRQEEETGGKTAERLEEEEEEQQPDRQKRLRKNVETKVPEKEDRAEEEAPVEEEVPFEEEAPVDKPVAEKSKKAANKKRIRKEDVSSDDEPGLPTKRISLPTTHDGWLVAAPKKRKAYRKEIDETEDKDVPDTSAETEKVSGLIVRKYVPPNNTSGSVGRAGNGKKKDFKGFRKNNVLRGYTSFNPYGRQKNHNQTSSLPKIRLVDVMPKESERQRQLQQQQQDLEREQELADQLFNDTGVAKSGRKRGSMDAYLTKSTTKRGRGRR